MTTPPPLFDTALRRARLARSRHLFGRGDFLHRRFAVDMADRVVELGPAVERGLIVADRGGLLAARLAERGWPSGDGLLVEGAAFPGESAWATVRVALELEQLPFSPGAFDLVLSVLALHWANDLVGALAQARRALRPGGAMIATLIGGATLGELRQALLQAEAELSGGAGPRVSPMLDPADAPSLMQRAGFAAPVVEVDRLRVRYSHILALMADLRAMGETNALIERPRAPLSRAVIARAQALYAQAFGEADGRLPVSFEVLTLTGWAGGPQPQ